jgi:hypothetical protein
VVWPSGFARRGRKWRTSQLRAYPVPVSHYDAFLGLPIDVEITRTRRWAAILARAVLIILVVGVVLSVIFWPAVSADVGALTLAITFAACAGLLVLRQALLAERR